MQAFGSTFEPEGRVQTYKLNMWDILKALMAACRQTIVLVNQFGLQKSAVTT